MLQDNAYELLNIKEGFTKEEIHEAFQEAMQLYSSQNPEALKEFSEDELLEIQSLIKSAYKNLLETHSSSEKQAQKSLEYDGSFLKAAREKLGMSINELSEITCIRSRNISSVEENDFLSLPAPVYTRGFVVQIAKALGLDEIKVANSYMKSIKSYREE